MGNSYLASGDELERAKRALQVGNIVLEVSQRLCRVSIGAASNGVAKLALAMLVSISEGLCLEGLLGAILFKEADILAVGENAVRSRESEVRARVNNIGVRLVVSEALKFGRCGPCAIFIPHRTNMLQPHPFHETELFHSLIIHAVSMGLKSRKTLSNV